jgi:hypothetical protein
MQFVARFKRGAVVGLLLAAISILVAQSALAVSLPCDDIDGRNDSSFVGADGEFLNSSGIFNAGEHITIIVDQASQLLVNSVVVSSTAGAGALSYTIPSTGAYTVSAVTMPFSGLTWSATCALGGGGSSKTGTLSARVVICADGRINYMDCEPIAIYPKHREDGYGLEVWIVDTSPVGRFGFYVSPAQLAALPDKPEQAIRIAESKDGFAALYKLSSGEYQVNAGPDFEGKVFVFRFSGLPPAAYPNVSTFMS